MRLLIVEPIVTSPRSLEERKNYFQRAVNPGTELELVSIPRGPKSIETFYDVALAGPEILRVIQKNDQDVDAIVINCFADPALDAAREITNKVVLGPGETSMSIALHLGAKFSVISVLPNTPYWVRMQAVKLGVASRLAAAIGVDVSVRELQEAPAQALAKLIKAAQDTVARDQAEAIILGCTGMAPLAERVRDAVEVPVIEPAITTVKMAELLVSLGLRHHRGTSYLPPDLSKVVGY
ncbi:MAG: aspartate/glutamate racemase family protein [Candidatus Bathyarchaeia archaeon]